MNVKCYACSYQDCQSIQDRMKKAMNVQDLCELKEALQLEVEIQKLKAEIQSIDYKVAQEASNFID